MKRIIWIVLLCGIAAAIGIVIGVRFTKDTYVVVIHNNSPHSLTNFRIVGGGCDEHFDPIIPGETIKHTFVIINEGKLRLSGNGETINGTAAYDKIIDDHVEKGREGMATVTVDQEGDLSAISEKGD